MTMGDRGPNEGLIGRPGSRHQLGTPALVLDLDVMEANIASLAEHARVHGYRVRPVAKIHKSAEVTRRQVEAGGLGPCCSTVAEAEAMADGGFRDIMLFTSVVTPPKLERLAALNARTGDMLVASDHAANVLQLGEAARRSGNPLRVLVDVEAGAGRTGLADPEAAVELARLTAETPGLEYAGVQGYNGVHMNMADFAARREAGLKILRPLAETVERLRQAGLEPEIVSGGGTGTHDIDPELGLLTEVQAGTYVFMDVNYRRVEMRRDDPHPFGHALLVRSTVISDAQPGFVITDAGIKETDAIFGIDAPEIFSGAPPGAVYTLVGDDMGRITFADPAQRMAVGDTVELIPPHCYQTAVLYRFYHVVSGDRLVDIWPVDAYDSW